MLSLTGLFSLCLLLNLALPLAAQSDDSLPQDEIIQRIAQQTALIENIETIGRLSEGLVFWQGVARMGGAFDGEFSYNAGGENVVHWTLRLSNALDKTEIEIVRAMQAIERSSAASEEDRANAAAINHMHSTLRELSWQIYEHLIADETDAAAAIFEAEIIPLRRQIAGRGYSAGDATRDQTSRMALDARLDRFPSLDE